MSALSVKQLSEKIDWEGSIQDVIEYGITPEDIQNPDLAKLWEEAVSAWSKYSAIVDAIEEFMYG